MNRERYLSWKMFILRLLFGAFFIWVASDKVLSPYQNFLYVVQGYQLFPDPIEELVAIIFPWIELCLGVLLVLGLQIKWVLRCFILIISSFILIIAQALIRKLPIEFCGCFGGLFSSKIQHTLLIDIGLWILAMLMLYSLEKTSFCSLDRYFSKTKNS